MIISTAYLPPLDYMMAIYSAKKVTIEAWESYPRQTWRNRCSIATANGKLDLVIPVEKPYGKNTRTGQVLISSRHSWQKNHWRAIESAYCKSPFFIYYSHLLEPLYLNPHPEKLTQWNQQLLQVVAQQILPLPPIDFSSSYQKTSGEMEDLRDAFSPKAHRQQKATAGLLPGYHQVFSERNGFLPNLSILDLLFNMGPQAQDYIGSFIKD